LGESIESSNVEDTRSFDDATTNLDALESLCKIIVQALLIEYEHDVGLQRLDGTQEELVAHAIDPATRVDDDSRCSGLGDRIESCINVRAELLQLSSIEIGAVVQRRVSKEEGQRRRRRQALLDVDRMVDRGRCNDARYRDRSLADIDIDIDWLTAFTRRII